MFLLLFIILSVVGGKNEYNKHENNGNIANLSSVSVVSKDSKISPSSTTPFNFISSIQELTLNSNLDKKDNLPKGGDNQDQADAIKGFLNNYNSVLNLIKPVLDNFVSNTADVTGRDNSEGKVKFQDNTYIASTGEFYSITLKIAVSILGILIVCTDINFVIRPEEVQIQETIVRIITAIILLSSGLLIMSFSIQFINEINKAFFGGQSITDYMQSLTNGIIDNLPDNNSIGQTLKTIFTLGTNKILGLIAAIPILLPFILILVMLFFISFQFIIRFVSLYFLSIIQPLASVFVISDKTKGINESFWKTWFTFLVTQPAFVLGYALVENILKDMLLGKITFTSIITFLALLIFLSSVGVIVTRIFGDAWTTINSNLSAVKGMKAFTYASDQVKRPITYFKDKAMGTRTTPHHSYNSIHSSLPLLAPNLKTSLLSTNKNSVSNNSTLLNKNKSQINIIKTDNSQNKSNEQFDKGKTLRQPKLPNLSDQSNVSGNNTQTFSPKSSKSLRGAIYT